jgi:tRNA/tmRNA/rRNA uracil-C5-methylase (TrmA/RlmC/RlmD family)
MDLEITAVAHGGHCVGRHEGRVVFVRHALPGELVRAAVTHGSTGSSFLRADAVEILRASPDRVVPPCPHAGPGKCGGCDWQHASLEAQRRLKADVVSEQLQRLARIERDVVVEELPGSPDGLDWRTRVRYAIDPQGRPGFRRSRSHEVEVVDQCLIATPTVRSAPVTDRAWPRTTEIEVIAGSGEAPGTVAVRVTNDAGSTKLTQGRTRVRERAAGRDWQVAAGGFWQVHPAAADTLVAAVLDAAQPQPGERCLDLYCGVGLFAGALAQVVGDARVDAVEADQPACANARRNLHDLPSVRITQAPVDRWLRAERPTADVVVLDPPRAGAGASVVKSVVAAGPRVVVYVACDPAALARDVATFAEQGYELAALRAFDLFPMTHHLECVATLVPATTTA